MHVPGPDNNSATDEHHGHCNHADVGRPNSYDYYCNSWFHRPNMAFILGIYGILKVGTCAGYSTILTVFFFFKSGSAKGHAKSSSHT